MSAVVPFPPRQDPPDRGIRRLAVARALRRRDSVRVVRDLLRYELLHQADRAAPGPRPLPSEADLAREYSTSRNVIRLALAALHREGIVERVPGAGTFVTTARVRQRQARLEGLASSLGSESHLVRQVPELVELRPAPRPVARALDLATGDEVLVVERRGLYDGRPCSLTTRYLPTALAPALLEGDLSHLDWYGAIEQAAGVALAGARVLTEAVLADDHLAPELEVPVGSPVLLLQRVVYTVTGAPVELSLTRVRGDVFEHETWLERR
jgi:GntR family transcriptional regulator